MPKCVRVTNEMVDAVLAPLNGVRIGDVFLKPVGKKGVRESCVLVRWACGHEVGVQCGNLKSGRTKGCGVHPCVKVKRSAAASASATAQHEQKRLANFAEAKAEAEAEGYTLTLLPDLRPEGGGRKPGGIAMLPWVSYTCPEGHSHAMTLHNWRRGRRCPGCADYGYQTSKRGTLYLCHRDLPGEVQRMYGITNNPARRLASHRSRGWVLIDRIDGNGQFILICENRIKKYMKAVGLHGSIYTGDDGETEAWAYDDLPIDSIRRVMHSVMEARVA